MLEIPLLPNHFTKMNLIRNLLILCIALLPLSNFSWAQKTPEQLRQQAAVYERMAASAQAKADATTDPQEKASYMRRVIFAKGMADSLHQEADQLERAAK